ncbi:hypothetical protein L0659_22245 [Dyadobacter sp. CY347]|nr:hypothetical protein [Dyadobacter sp. CY347]
MDGFDHWIVARLIVGNAFAVVAISKKSLLNVCFLLAPSVILVLLSVFNLVEAAYDHIKPAIRAI